MGVSQSFRRTSVIFFSLFGQDYRTDEEVTKVERLDGGEWVEVRNPRAIARAHVEVRDQLLKNKGESDDV